MILILGAGLAGLSCSYHLGHANCLVLEAGPRPGGHIASEVKDGFTWDEGPHVSFTKDEYVQQLFADGVEQAFDEYEVKVGNYYRGHWITHPAQTSLHQVPEPLRTQCLDAFLATRSEAPGAPPANYMAWLEAAFGPVFARTFPATYTRKYWTRDAADLGTDWVGQRVFYPKVDEVVHGARAPLPRPMHYISKVRYPRRGGFERFATKLADGARVRCHAEVVQIDLQAKRVRLADGEVIPFDTLINTIALPAFVALCTDLPEQATRAVPALSCTQLLLVNVMAAHAALRPEHWIYVYDEDKFSTRITTTEHLTPGNAPEGHTGLQVEVYASRHKPLTLDPRQVGQAVIGELTQMGLLRPSAIGDSQAPRFELRSCPWANVIFDHGTRPALDDIWSALQAFGLEREDDDLHPMTDWAALPAAPRRLGPLVMAGRFAQWKYFWTDDCVLRGRHIARSRTAP